MKALRNLKHLFSLGAVLLLFSKVAYTQVPVTFLDDSNLWTGLKPSYDGEFISWKVETCNDTDYVSITIVKSIDNSKTDFEQGSGIDLTIVIET